MAAKLEKTSVPGIYKRHFKGCTRPKAGCKCTLYLIWKHKGVQHKEKFATMAEAREAKARRQMGDRKPRARETVRDYAPAWIEAYRGRTSKGFGEATRLEYRRDVKQWIVPYFGTRRMDEVEPPDVREWFGWIEQRGGSESAVRKAKQVASAMFATARDDGLIRDNPVAGTRYVPAPGVKRRVKIKPLSTAEVERLMGAVKLKWRVLFLLASHTGLRISELLGLNWEHVHLGDDPHLTVSEQVYKGERKGLKSENANRVIPLSPGMARALAEHKQGTDYPEPGAPVFASAVGTPMDYQNVHRRVWLPAKEAAGITGRGAWHRLRHTLATMVEASGELSIRQLCDLLGHHDPAFTYKQYVGRGESMNVDFLDELVPSGDQGSTKPLPQ